MSSGEDGGSVGRSPWRRLPDMLGMRDSRGSVSLSSLFSAGKHTDKRFPIISGSTGNGILTTSAHNGIRRQLFSPLSSLTKALTSQGESAAGLLSTATSLSPYTDVKSRETGSHTLTQSILERQGEVNKLNTQLSRMNYLVNVANFIKNHNMQKALEAERMHREIMDSKMHQQQVEISRLNESVGRLSEEIKEQRELSARLSSSLDTQKTLLSKSILESRYEMERQCYLIDQQQKMVQKLMEEKVRHDFMVDTTIILLSVYISQSPLLLCPLQAVLHLLPQRKSHRWGRQFIRLIFIVHVFRMFKQFAIEAGIHNSVRSAVPYLQTIGDYFRTTRLFKKATGVTDISAL